MIEVSAGWIEENGRILLCRRPLGKANGGMWEFPGGKREEGESGQETLERELTEELGIRVKAGEEMARTVWNGPRGEIAITLYPARLTEGEITLLEHSEMKWLARSELAGMELCPADRELLGMI